MRILKKIALASVMIIMGAAVAACGDKTPVSAEDFSDGCANAGYTVYNDTAKAESIEELEEFYRAVSEDGNHEIRFFIFTDDDGAKNIYEYYTASFEEAREAASKSSHTSVSVGNHANYSTTYDGVFGRVARVDNTLMVCYADEDAKDAVDELIEGFGY